MEKLLVLKKTSVGSRIAEQEMDGLKDYFLKTYLWEQLLHNEVDVVFGCKGSGKSALYNYLSSYSYELINYNAMLVLAENPRGTVAFKDLNATPPIDEFEFKSIWKLYFVLIVTQKLLEEGYSDKFFEVVVQKLQESDLLPRRTSFSAIVRLVRDYISKIRPSIEPNVSINEHTGMIEKIGVKISLSEPSTKSSDKGVVSVDFLLDYLNKSLETSKEKTWIAIDRLDAVFQDNFDLEATALRTLFQVYIDFLGYENIRLIIFLRDDIWNKIIENGFRETSHITKTELIKWDQSSLFELIMSRFCTNEHLLSYLGVEKPQNLQDKKAFFLKIFPLKRSSGQTITFEWLVSRIEDGNGNATPRELIQLINAAIKSEINLLSEGNTYNGLIREESINAGLKDASKTKLDTMVAEYPQIKNFVYRLKGQKVRHSVDELKEYWGCSRKDAKVIINNLLKLGFFKNESQDESNPLLFIPVIFRPALNIQYV